MLFFLGLDSDLMRRRSDSTWRYLNLHDGHEKLYKLIQIGFKINHSPDLIDLVIDKHQFDWNYINTLSV